MLERFHKISDKFPASEIERKGKVPEELLAELQTIGFFGLDIPREFSGLGLNISQYLGIVEDVATQNIEGSHCKLFGTTKAWEALYDALQVAGGDPAI